MGLVLALSGPVGEGIPPLHTSSVCRESMGMLAQKEPNKRVLYANVIPGSPSRIVRGVLLQGWRGQGDVVQAADRWVGPPEVVVRHLPVMTLVSPAGGPIDHGFGGRPLAGEPADEMAAGNVAEVVVEALRRLKVA